MARQNGEGSTRPTAALRPLLTIQRTRGRGCGRRLAVSTRARTARNRTARPDRGVPVRFVAVAVDGPPDNGRQRRDEGLDWTWCQLHGTSNHATCQSRFAAKRENAFFKLPRKRPQRLAVAQSGGPGSATFRHRVAKECQLSVRVSRQAGVRPVRAGVAALRRETDRVDLAPTSGQPRRPLLRRHPDA